MSSSLLPFVQVQLTRFGLPTVLILGNIGNGFIVLLFSKHRKNACSMYLLSGAVMNIVYLTYNILLSLYTSYYNDPTLLSPVFCRLRYYLSHVWGQMARYFIVLACIDRFVMTSIRARSRALSRPPIAWCLMAIITIIWHLFGIHIPILTKIQNGRCGQFETYYIVYTVYFLIGTSLIPPGMMAIFGKLAYRNMRQLHARVQPIGNTANPNRSDTTIHRRDRDLLVMLLAEVIFYIVTAGLYPCILLETSITNLMTVSKSLERTQIESFVTSIGAFLGYTNSAAPFYLYLIASNTFRRDVKQLVNNSWRRITKQPIVTVNQQLTATMNQQTRGVPMQETGV
jgi:hypothetical protein